mmetsp:Transcript_26152/g.66444  ORF Transcript_26152/g.66444 Transcript_26152/m.66444 type:complete len:947 (-) Transcript_26152:2225-5065(-)
MGSLNEELAHLLGKAGDKYIVQRQLGSGTYSRVYRAVRKGNPDEVVALKIMDLKPWKLQPSFSVDKIVREVKLMRGLVHSHVVRLHEMFESENSIVLVLELVDGGDLFDLIIKQKKVPEDIAKEIFYQLVSAVKYMHEQGVVHRDLKPENILVSAESQWPPIVKIGDFGLAKGIGGTASLPKTFCGTPQYLAPEVLGAHLSSTGNLQAGFAGVYGKEADFWSLGGILYVMLCGQYAFKDGLTPSMVQSQLNPASPPLLRFGSPVWQGISNEAKDLLVRLLAVDPMKRFGAKECLQHPWIAPLAQRDAEAKRKEQAKQVNVRKEMGGIARTASIVSNSSSIPSQDGYTVMEAAIGDKEETAESVTSEVVPPRKVPDNARVQSSHSQRRDSDSHYQNGYSNGFDKKEKTSDKMEANGGGEDKAAHERRRMEDMVRSDLKIGELLSLQSSIAQCLSVVYKSMCEVTPVSYLLPAERSKFPPSSVDSVTMGGRQGSMQKSGDMVTQAEVRQESTAMMGVHDAAASLSPIGLVRRAANQCRARHLEALKLVRKFRSTANTALALLPDITAAVDDNVVEFVSNIFLKLRTWVMEIRDESALLTSSYNEAVNEISVILDSPAVRNLVSYVVPSAHGQSSVAALLSSSQSLSDGRLLRSLSDGEGVSGGSGSGSSSHGSPDGRTISGFDGVGEKDGEFAFPQKVDKAFGAIFDNRPHKRRKGGMSDANGGDGVAAKGRKVSISADTVIKGGSVLDRSRVSGRRSSPGRFKEVTTSSSAHSSPREPGGVSSAALSASASGEGSVREIHREGSGESSGGEDGFAKKWHFKEDYESAASGSEYSGALPLGRERESTERETSALINLRRAFEELQRLENSLGRTTQFWMKFESITQMVLQNDATAAEYVAFLESSPSLRKRFIDRLKQMELFWTVFRGVCTEFVNASSLQLDTIYSFL